MKKIITLLFAASTLVASAEGTGIYLSGTMNDWATADAAWELQTEPDMPGWAYIDLTDMAAGTEFRIVGHGRDFGMKNTRNIIRPNSLHLPTEGGTYNLTVCEEGLDDVHLLVLTEDFETSKYGSIITRNADTKTLYGVCMQSSVTPTLLEPIVNTSDVVGAEVEITEPWYVIKAYQLSNATQTVCNYGLSEADAANPGKTGTLIPTSFMTPTAAAIPVPAEGSGKYMVQFNYETNAYAVGGELSIDTITVGSIDNAIYYNLQGIQVTNPQPGQIYILRTPSSTRKVLLK